MTDDQTFCEACYSTTRAHEARRVAVGGYWVILCLQCFRRYMSE